jgi:flagellar biosynthesis component FlhA
VEYVRRELCDRIAVEACGVMAIGNGTARVYETTPEFEATLERWHDVRPTDAELRAARSAVGGSLAGARVDNQPVIVTSARARRLLRTALDHEIPDVQVLARTELIPGLDVARVGLIG